MRMRQQPLRASLSSLLCLLFLQGTLWQLSSADPLCSSSTCAAEVRPVCGSDGKSYSSACVAGCAGVQVATQGYCEGDSVRFWQPFSSSSSSSPSGPAVPNWRIVKEAEAVIPPSVLNKFAHDGYVYRGRVQLSKIPDYLQGAGAKASRARVQAAKERAAEQAATPQPTEGNKVAEGTTPEGMVPDNPQALSQASKSLEPKGALDVAIVRVDSAGNLYSKTYTYDPKRFLQMAYPPFNPSANTLIEQKYDRTAAAAVKQQQRPSTSPAPPPALPPAAAAKQQQAGAAAPKAAAPSPPTPAANQVKAAPVAATKSSSSSNAAATPTPAPGANSTRSQAPQQAPAAATNKQTAGAGSSPSTSKSSSAAAVPAPAAAPAKNGGTAPSGQQQQQSKTPSSKEVSGTAQAPSQSSSSSSNSSSSSSNSSSNSSSSSSNNTPSSPAAKQQQQLPPAVKPAAASAKGTKDMSSAANQAKQAAPAAAAMPVSSSQPASSAANITSEPAAKAPQSTRAPEAAAAGPSTGPTSPHSSSVEGASTRQGTQVQQQQQQGPATSGSLNRQMSLETAQPKPEFFRSGLNVNEQELLSSGSKSSSSSLVDRVSQADLIPEMSKQSAAGSKAASGSSPDAAKAGAPGASKPPSSSSTRGSLHYPADSRSGSSSSSSSRQGSSDDPDDDEVDKVQIVTKQPQQQHAESAQQRPQQQPPQKQPSQQQQPPPPPQQQQQRLPVGDDADMQQALALVKDVPQHTAQERAEESATGPSEPSSNAAPSTPQDKDPKGSGSPAPAGANAPAGGPGLPQAPDSSSTPSSPPVSSKAANKPPRQMPLCDSNGMYCRDKILATSPFFGTRTSASLYVDQSWLAGKARISHVKTYYNKTSSCLRGLQLTYKHTAAAAAGTSGSSSSSTQQQEPVVRLLGSAFLKPDIIVKELKLAEGERIGKAEVWDPRCIKFLRLYTSRGQKLAVGKLEPGAQASNVTKNRDNGLLVGLRGYQDSPVKHAATAHKPAGTSPGVLKQVQFVWGAPYCDRNCTSAATSKASGLPTPTSDTLITEAGAWPTSPLAAVAMKQAASGAAAPPTAAGSSSGQGSRRLLVQQQEPQEIPSVEESARLLQQHSWLQRKLVLTAAAEAQEPAVDADVASKLPDQTDKGLEGPLLRRGLRSVTAGSNTSSIAVPASLHRMLSVIKPDDRQPCPVRAFPYETMGQIKARATDGGFVCSGGLIGSNRVLTAGHCVWDDRNTQGPFKDLRFSPGQWKQDGKVGSLYGAVDWDYVTLFETYVNDPDASGLAYDVAVISLSKPVGTELGWLGIKADSSPCRPTPTSLTLAGYPGDDPDNPRPGGWAGGCFYDKCDVSFSCSVSITNHTCDSYVGQSGAPMFDDQNYVRAVHTLGVLPGFSTTNGAITIQKFILDNVMGYWRENDGFTRSQSGSKDKFLL